jgi:hypothetical protein
MSKLEIIYTLFHDKYETLYGDGLYPYYKNDDKKTLEPIDITFKLDSAYTWKQKQENYCIRSLDNATAKALLRDINELANYTKPCVLLNSFGTTLYRE